MDNKTEKTPMSNSSIRKGRKIQAKEQRARAKEAVARDRIIQNRLNNMRDEPSVNHWGFDE